MVTLWNGEQFRTSAQSPHAVITLPDRATLWRLCRSPSMTFGDEYTAGRIRVEGDLVEFCRTIEQAWAALPRKPLSRRPRPNTVARSRDNVYHHYDLGNDFYRLWLDQELAYTCAYFRTPDVSLEQAQRDKFDHVCRKLRLEPGQTVVEAGCGWGGLALHMARNYGVRVKAYNISREQIAFARQRAAAEGLDRQVEFIEADWRTIEGRFDAFVSVGMLEHVGPENYRELGEVIQRTLKSDGMGLIHTIGRNLSQPVDAWTERRIFPGSFVPTLVEMMEIFEAGSFSVLDVENLRLHYARTVEHWLDRFDRHVATIRDMFGERFVRMWRLYLAASSTTFEAGNMQLFQVVFSHSRNNKIPRTREHLYQLESRI
jgi:cyclopropane-fatty-acyl-phospholipid synthase